MSTMNISLPEQMKTWVEEQTEDGKFSNSSDYVRHLIRRDQERAEAVRLIKAEYEKGLASGEPEPFDAEAFKKRMRRKHRPFRTRKELNPCPSSPGRSPDQHIRQQRRGWFPPG